MSEERFAVPDEVTRVQRAASDPEASAWVRANAGAGKTYVLAQRVLRLLLAGTDPARILCITYTKAAAAEMANRVFDWLGRWATMEEAALAEALEELQGRPASPEELLRARRLFAKAIETPGRLRVQTIHAFCERLLQQFPFEASVAAGFSVLDERGAAELLADARSAVLVAAAQSGAELGPDLELLAAEAGDNALAEIFGAVLRRKADFHAWMRRDGDPDGALESLAAALGLAPGEDEAAIAGQILNGPILQRSEWQSVVECLSRGSVTDRNMSERLAAASIAEGVSGLEDYLCLFLKQDGEPRKSVVTKAVRDCEPELADRLEQEKDRVFATCDRLKAARILAGSRALFRMADAVIAHYERLKAASGFLDYDDLIERAANLLSRADAAWVLYKLDGGLDHLLVDEAQDTSPRQWDVVQAIVGEFFAGKSARETGRTIFAVGDEKQSIYSFQGADPARFDGMRRTFATKVEALGQQLQDRRIRLSFRSTPAVLEAVDRVFRSPAAAQGLNPGEMDEAVIHEAIRRTQRGRVEIWDVEKPHDPPVPEPWDMPFDVVRAGRAEARLADQIAGTIRSWIDGKERLESTGEPIRAGDVMILVRNRRPFAEPMIRALKAAGIAVAGADRLVLTDHVAVMDLMALGRFCLMPEDDLTLASLFKSPLLGLCEEDLMAVAIGRRGSLWNALREAATSEARYAAAVARLKGWRGQAGFERPYEFYAGILGRDGVRTAFHQRLGAEAFEALDEFLSLALNFERIASPTLPGFLHWLDAAPSEVKRDMEKGRDEVRVMTVHGAKGLEAPIVFLPDTCRDPEAGKFDGIFRFGGDGEGGPLVWAPRKKDDCSATRGLRNEAVVKRCEEDHRLLYVAMTRARDRLYVAGFEGKLGRKASCWYDLVHNALRDELEDVSEDGSKTVWRMRSDLPAAEPAELSAPASASAAPPAWIARKAPREQIERRQAPSHLAEHASRNLDVPDPVARRTALKRGRIIHRLLESLPEIAPERRAAAAERALATLAGDLDEPGRAAMLAEVMAVLDDPGFARAFLPGGRAEVAIAGRIAGLDGPVVGQIDRLAVAGQDVLIVDYKTDRAIPEAAAHVSPGYLAQMAAYRILVSRLYPHKTVRAAILWTAAPRLMALPGALLDTHGPGALLDATLAGT